MMKKLLTVTAIFESLTGLNLIAAPALLASLIFGSPLDTPTSVMVGRVAGAALLALGIACWAMRIDSLGKAARGFVGAMLFYNIAVILLLVYSLMESVGMGVAFYPVIIVHAMLAIWCI